MDSTPTTFITGDRAFASVYVLLAAIEMLRATQAGHALLVGDSETGVDAIVQDLAQRAGVPVVRVQTTEAGYDARNARVLEMCDSVVVIHAAPEESSRTKSLLQVDAVSLVTHMDLMI